MGTGLGTGSLSPTWLFVFALHTQAFKDLQSDVLRSISERMSLRHSVPEIRLIGK